MNAQVTTNPDAPTQKRKPKNSNSETIKFLTRAEVAERWRCSKESVKRRQRAGLLNPVYLSERKLLYRIGEVEAVEAAAVGGTR
jgi:hypothetical protein